LEYRRHCYEAAVPDLTGCQGYRRGYKGKIGYTEDADYIFREEIKNAGLDREINQYFAVLTV